MIFWKSVDLKKLQIPDDLLEKRSSVKIDEGCKDVNGIKVFYRKGYLEEQDPSDICLLLLHGMRFSSKTWLDLGTIHTAASIGYHTIAVDIPGYGNSPTASITDKALFLQQLLEVFEIKKPVIVSPSMSGFFTLPFIVKNPNFLCGYVPVAPVGIEVLEALTPIKGDLDPKEIYEPLKDFYTTPIPDLSFISTPTMVVYGERDRSRSSALLSLLPQSQCQEIPNASHPAYLDDPHLWHKLLYNFLCNLSNLP